MRCEASRSDPGMERFVAFFVVSLYISCIALLYQYCAQVCLETFNFQT